MNLFDISAKITLDSSEFQSGIEKTGKTIGKFAKVAGAAMAAGAAAIGSLAASAVKAYADYEQLAGGVEKLFGKEAATTMMQYAQDAYKTAGMSANQFLEQSTSFAAALIQSYSGDTIKAAEQANKAMAAISDNFNTFGGDISTLQSAFQAFAKQNYTLLDNLKLGYGGTKAEMERLIADANEYAKSIGQAGDLSIDSFGDIVEAIDLVQQKQGIAGTTAKEAATTISGSIGMVKAAWQNLLVAFADKDADLGQYFSALSSSAETAFMNILPVAEQALMGIGDVVANLAPVIGERFPELVSNILPNLLSAVTSLITSLSAAFPSLIGPLLDGIIAALPQLIESGITLFAGLAVALVDAIPQIIAALPQIWQALKEGFTAAWPVMKEAGLKLIAMVAAGISAAWGLLVGKATEVWDGVKESVLSSWEEVKGRASEIWNGVKSSVSSAWDGIKSGVTNAASSVRSTVSSAFSAVASTASSIWDGIKSTISNVMDGIKEKIRSAIDTIKSIVNFTWSLPKLKLPHFSISGGFSLNPPSVPTLSVTWNKKALNEPFMFHDATLFGAGEAGDEVLYGKSNLMNDIKAASTVGNSELAAKMDSILAILDKYLPEAIHKQVYLDTGLLVGGIGTEMDNQLGAIDSYRGRGLSLA